MVKSPRSCTAALSMEERFQSFRPGQSKTGLSDNGFLCSIVLRLGRLVALHLAADLGRTPSPRRNHVHCESYERQRHLVWPTGSLSVLPVRTMDQSRRLPLLFE